MLFKVKDIPWGLCVCSLLQLYCFFMMSSWNCRPAAEYNIMPDFWAISLYTSVWLDHLSRYWGFISCNHISLSSLSSANVSSLFSLTCLSWIVNALHVIFLESSVRKGTFKQEINYTGTVNVFMTINWLLADELFRKKLKSVPSRNELHIVIALSPFHWVLYSTKLILG